MITRYDTNWVMSGDSVTIELSEKLKWDVTSEEDYTVLRYKDVEGFEVISGERAVWLDEEFGDDADENHEYLKIYMKNGKTVTFRNSHAVLFNI